MKREAIKSISLKSLTHELPDGRKLFQDVNVDFPLGEIIWFRGESGTGKSLLIKMLLGVVIPGHGKLLINDSCITDMTFEEFLPYKLNMGLSFDFGGLIHNRDLRGNLSLPLEYHKFGSEHEITDQVNKYLEAFNLKDLAHERPSSVVGGVRKAVCVARAFVHEPQILFLDDPTTGLRGETKSRLKLMVQEAHKKGQTVIIATEDGAFMEDLQPLVFDFIDQSIRLDVQRKAA